MNTFYKYYDDISSRLQQAGEFIPLTLLRVILFWEFWESGVSKLRGENWFASVPWADWQTGFLFPFDVLPTGVSWFMATWGEIVFALLLLLGLFTRFAAFSLVMITVVAMSSVHWPNTETWSSFSELLQGYVITADGFGNYKLALLFILMLLPLVFYGGGKLSVDRLLLQYVRRRVPDAAPDSYTLGLGGFVIAICIIYLFPLAGALLLAASLVAIALHFRNNGL